MFKALFLILMLVGFISAQTAPKQDVWTPLKFFVGAWVGTGKGEPGESTVEREYKFILNGRFLQASHKSIYAPQAKNPKGETHEDLGFFSYDRSRKQFVFRQFHTEGFVNGYVATNISEDGKTLVFTTESIENIPSGFRARETYKSQMTMNLPKSLRLPSRERNLQFIRKIILSVKNSF
jgi:hypothetical protein